MGYVAILVIYYARQYFPCFRWRPSCNDHISSLFRTEIALLYFLTSMSFIQLTPFDFYGMDGFRIDKCHALMPLFERVRES